MNLPAPKLEWQTLPMREQVVSRLRQLNSDILNQWRGKGLHPSLEYEFLTDHILLHELEVAIQDYTSRHGKAIEDGVSLDDDPPIRWVAVGNSQIFMAHKEQSNDKV